MVKNGETRKKSAKVTVVVLDVDVWNEPRLISEVQSEHVYTLRIKKIRGSSESRGDF